MPRRTSTRLPEAERALLVSQAQIERELGWTNTQRQRAQRRNPELWRRFVRHDLIGQSDLYDSRLIECLRAFYGQPHREVTESGRDWLSTYLSGGST